MGKYQKSKKIVRNYFEALEKADAETIKNLLQRIIPGKESIPSANSRGLMLRQEPSGSPY